MRQGAPLVDRLARASLLKLAFSRERQAGYRAGCGPGISHIIARSETRRTETAMRFDSNPRRPAERWANSGHSLVV